MDGRVVLVTGPASGIGLAAAAGFARLGAGRHLSELHIDRAYLPSALVRDRGPDLAIFCKAWQVRTPAAGSPRTSSPSTSQPGS